MATASSSPQPLNRTDQQEVRVYAHSHLFYWWPVWVCGFIMAILTLIDDHRMVIVPAKTTVDRTGEGTYLLKANGPVRSDEQLENAAKAPNQPAFHLRAAHNSRLGPIFVFVLLLVILITSVPMRGLWSVVVIITLILGAIILALADLWDRIFESLGHLHIHANMAMYLFIAIGLLVMWAVTFFFFDHQTYMIFTPGQLRVCLEIGGGETAYDTQ